MAFPFPPNPSDGQTVSYITSDGNTIEATYKQTSNEWIIRHPDPSVVITSNIPYTIGPGLDGQVIMWSDATKAFTLKHPKTTDLGDVSGTTPSTGDVLKWDGSHYSPGPATGGATLRLSRSNALPTSPHIGDLDVVIENLHHELNVFDGTTWQEVLKETSIKSWIAAGSLFQGIRDSKSGVSGLDVLPSPSLSNKGY